MDTKPTHQLEEKFEMRFFQSNLDEKDDNRLDILNMGQKTHQRKNGEDLESGHHRK